MGTPPQRLELKVDISSSITYVKDATLSDQRHCKNDHFFSGQTSSTFRTNNTRHEAWFQNDFVEVSGIAAVDTFDLGRLHIPGQGFLDADHERFNGIGWDDYCGMDGIIGLSNSNVSSALGFLGPFLNLVENESLDMALFGLRLREPAELSLGRVNQDLFRGDFTRVPLQEGDKQDDSLGQNGPWQTSIDYIMAGSDPALHYVLGGERTYFTTTSAFSYIPDMVFEDLIMNSLGFEDMPFLPPSIDCGQRALLPDLTFNLANRNLTISPYDYTLEWLIPDESVRCVTAILPNGELQGGKPEVVLGSAFLRGFYTVFDLDSQTIGCK